MTTEPGRIPTAQVAEGKVDTTDAGRQPPAERLLGELYGGAIESRMANDLQDILAWESTTR